MAKREWTPEEDAILQDRIDAGGDWTDAVYAAYGKKLNRKTSQVFNRVQKLVKDKFLAEMTCEDDGSCIRR